MLKQRILDFLDVKRVTQYKFFKETGFPQGNLNREGGLSEQNIDRFLKWAGDEINLDWFFHGKGEMLKASENKADGQKYFLANESDMDYSETISYLREKDNAHAEQQKILQGQVTQQQELNLKMMNMMEGALSKSDLHGLFKKLSEDVEKIPAERPNYMSSLNDLTARNEELEGRFTGMEERMKNMEGLMESILNHFQQKKSE